jgi:hypothetical protein
MMPHHPNSGQSQNIEIANELFENLREIQMLGDDTNKSECHA